MASQRLKLKDELNYKKGPTSGGCSQCNHYIRNFKVRSMNGEFLGIEPRCKVMGLENSRRYRINPDNICKCFDNSVHMMRLMGENSYRRNNGEDKYAAALSAMKLREGFIAEMLAAGSLSDGSEG